MPFVYSYHTHRRLQVHSFSEILLSVPAKTVNEYVRECLADVIANDIMGRLEITERPIPEQDAIEYRAQLRIVRSDYEFE